MKSTRGSIPRIISNIFNVRGNKHGAALRILPRFHVPFPYRVHHTAMLKTAGIFVERKTGLAYADVFVYVFVCMCVLP